MQLFFIVDVKIDKWTRRLGPYLQLLTHFVSFNIPERCYPLLLEQVDDCEKMCIFLESKKGKYFL